MTWKNLAAKKKARPLTPIHTIPAGEYIKEKYKDYNFDKVSGGRVLINLIASYEDRFGTFPSESTGEILRDKAYKEWKILNDQWSRHK